MNSARPHPSTQRSVWKTFLTPGWVFTAAAVLIFAYFAFTVLAPWQLHKNEAKTEETVSEVKAPETEVKSEESEVKEAEKKAAKEALNYIKGKK